MGNKETLKRAERTYLRLVPDSSEVKSKMKISTIIFAAALLIGVSTYVNSHKDIHTFIDLFGDAQNFFGLLGSVGSVTMAYFTNSGNATKNLLKKLTGNGRVETPPE